MFIERRILIVRNNRKIVFERIFLAMLIWNIGMLSKPQESLLIRQYLISKAHRSSISIPGHYPSFRHLLIFVVNASARSTTTPKLNVM